MGVAGRRRGREEKRRKKKRERGEVELWNLSRYGGPDGQLGLLRSSATTTTTTTPTFGRHSLLLLLFLFCCCLSTILRLGLCFLFYSISSLPPLVHHGGQRVLPEVRAVLLLCRCPRSCWFYQICLEVADRQFVRLALPLQ